MKRIFTFILLLAATTLLPLAASADTATFDFSSPTFREVVGEKLADVKANIYNETFAADGVTLQVTGGSAPTKLYVDANRGQCLVLYKEYATLTFRAPAGKAITKIEFTAAGNSNIKNFAASSGAIDEMTWTGNADGVRFTQGGTSYLANAIVTLADKTAETAAFAGLSYVTCDNIAAFNALENGTYAKVTLTNAEIIGKSADGYSTVWMQDATGGCWIQYTSLNDRLKENTRLNGFVYTVKRSASGTTQMKETENMLESELAETSITGYTMLEGTIAELNKAENLNRVVKLTGVRFEVAKATETIQNGTLTQGDDAIDINNGGATANQLLHKMEFTEGQVIENATVIGILSPASATKNQILPISISAGEEGNYAGDGTLEKPYTVGELNAQKDALAALGNTVWVKADLRSLGENMDGLFGDATDTFTAYSEQILQGLTLSDLTNTKDLLIALTYGTEGHAYGNTANPQYASCKEPAEAHFSLSEVRGALTVKIENGLRGYHVPACYRVPQGVIAVKVSAGYTAKNGAYVNYTNFDGATEGSYVTPKDAALVLMAPDGDYELSLVADLYEQTISNGNAMNPGTQEGLNAGTAKNRARFRFVNEGGKTGFQRNSDENCTVTLQSKDEVFLQVSSLDNNFWGNYAWESEAKDWITWGGGKYADFHDITGIKSLRTVTTDDAYYSLSGQRVEQPRRGLYIRNGKKIFVR